MARWLLALALLWAAARPGRAQAAPRPLCPADEPLCRAQDVEGLNEYPYVIDGVSLLLEYLDGDYFVFECTKNLTLDNTALPRFQLQLRVNKIQIENCPPPRVSYADVFHKLNVVAKDKLKLIKVGDLTGAHLAHLPELPALELSQARLAARALDQLPRLRRLSLDRVRLPAADLRRLPPQLDTLQLIRMGADVTPAVLAGLPRLASLHVRDSLNVSVALSPSLRALALESPGVRVPSALSGELRTLSMNGWAERRPAAWSACGALHTLDVRMAAAELLPARWAGACAALRVLRVQLAPQLRALHASALRGARLLRELTLSSTALSALPAGLLDDAVELRVLDLSGNHLKELPGGLFVSTKSLQTLNLSKNSLTTGVYMSLSAVTSLTTLNLSFNDLKDSCGGADDTVRGSSPLQNLKLMTTLNLRKTNTSLMCRDWRETMLLLKTLDLSWNNFTSVTYTDLLFRGGERVQVELSHNPLRALRYDREDLRRVLAGETSRADVKLDGRLDCDCRAYWAARALRERPAHLQLSAECAGGGGRAVLLRDVALDALVCGAPELCARAPACACAVRDSGEVAPASVLRVSCARAGLTRVADALAPVAAALRERGESLDAYEWQLHLAHNRISDLSVADFPKYLSVLDLTNNSLSAPSARDVRVLLAEPRRRAHLARNPLRCDCGAADTLAALHAHHAALADYARLTCASGQRLAAARAAPCAAPLGAGALAGLLALAALLLAGGALGLLLWHPALRRRLKAALHRRGWLPAEPEPDDDAERRFDVFLSFSHGDERFVRDELVARLERGPAPYRVCVHYRDWAPGGWIPAQIAASVRASRRTVAVVSEHFLRSAWARAEFQEAHALALRSARPRLVVVLLDEPARLPLDATLRGYLAANTYVQWGDPWFWDKLRRALPRGRAPAPEAEVCSDPSAALEHSAPADAPSSACSSSSSSCSSSTHSSSPSSPPSPRPSSPTRSVLELSRLMPAAYGSHYVGELVPA